MVRPRCLVWRTAHDRRLPKQTQGSRGENRAHLQISEGSCSRQSPVTRRRRHGHRLRRVRVAGDERVGGL
eukprot:3358314-Pleurochrysis_carterae.AAC.1